MMHKLRQLCNDKSVKKSKSQPEASVPYPRNPHLEPKSTASNMLRMSFYTFRALPLDLQSNALEPAKQCLSTCKAMLCELQTNAP